MHSASREDRATLTVPTAEEQAVVTAVMFVQAFYVLIVAANVWAEI